MGDHIDIDELRRRAREQLDQRLPPRTLWVQEFEACLRARLLPRAELFLAVMAAADNPGLEDQRDHSGLERGWIIGFVLDYPAPGVDTRCLTLSPGQLGLQVAFGNPTAQSTAIVSTLPAKTIISSGEVEQASALGEVALHRYVSSGGASVASPEASAEAFAVECDRRMLALLCSHELTFPDRDLTGVAWDAFETALIVREEQRRREKRRTTMTVEQFAQWMEGTLGETDLVVPPLTGTEFSYALALTSIEPKRRMHRNWRNQLIDKGEKGWQVGESSTMDSETSSTTVLTFIRRDGTGFQETTSLSYSSASTTVVEFAADHIYEPAVYSNYLSTRLFYAQRDMTS